MAVAVGITIDDQDGNPVDGVAIQVYDRLGTTLQGSGTSGDDGAGRFELNLTGDETGVFFHVRAYLVGIGTIYTPVLLYADRKTIQVYEPLPSGMSNEFTLTYNTGALDPATDPNMCRCHGLVKKNNNVIYPGYIFYIRDLLIPELVHAPISGGVSGALMAGDRLTLRSDAQGEVVVDLVRNGIYLAHFPDRWEEPCKFIVPDQSSVDLFDCIWLWPKAVTFANTTISMSVGDEVEVEISQFTMSNDRTTDVDGDEYDPSRYTDPEVSVGSSVVSVQWLNGKIKITALAAGTATVILSPKEHDDSRLPVRLPQAQLSQTPISITVT